MDVLTGKGKKGIVGDSTVLFYPRYSDNVPYPVIRMVGISQTKDTLMVVYRG